MTVIEKKIVQCTPYVGSNSAHASLMQTKAKGQLNKRCSIERRGDSFNCLVTLVLLYNSVAI